MNLSEFFLKLLNMSISGGWLILAVLVLRLLLKKAPKWINVFLWGLVAFRLVLPFRPESIFSLIPSAGTIPMDIGLSQTPAIDSGIPVINHAINPMITQSAMPTPAASVNPMQIVIAVAANVWILGMVAMLLYALISYLRLKHTIGTAIPLEKGVYQSENVSSPFVLGIIKPKIYLPFSTKTDNIPYVIAHEKAHIARFDHLWKPIGFLLLTVYWFHPLMWLAYVLLCKDIELACDNKVIASLDNDGRADYSEALLSFHTRSRLIAACPLAFGEVGVKERVKAVLHYKKPAFWVLLIALVACIVTAVCFLTDPVEDKDIEEPVGVEITSDDIRVAENILAPEAAILFGKECIQQDIRYQNMVGKQNGYTVIDAELTVLDRISTGTAGLNAGIDLYRLEYRLRVDHPENISESICDKRMDEDAITEWEHDVGQPYLLIRWEYRGEETVYTPVCTTNTEQIQTTYGTPEMLEKYGNFYTAAAVELCHKFGQEIENSTYHGSVSGAHPERLDIYTASGAHVTSIPTEAISNFYASELPNAFDAAEVLIDANFYYGKTGDLEWTFVVSKPAFFSSVVNLFVRGGDHPDGELYMDIASGGIVMGASFVTEKNGFITLQTPTDKGFELLYTADSGKTWQSVEVEPPEGFTPTSYVVPDTLPDGKDEGLYPFTLVKETGEETVWLALDEDGKGKW